MCRCNLRDWWCGKAISRCSFLRGCGAAAATAGGLASLGRAAEGEPEGKPRVAVVFLAQVRDSWPYPGFDIEGRQRELMAALKEGCPQVDFVPLSVRKPDQVQKAAALKDEVDALLVRRTSS